MSLASNLAGDNAPARPSTSHTYCGYYLSVCRLRTHHRAISADKFSDVQLVQELCSYCMLALRLDGPYNLIELRLKWSTCQLVVSRSAVYNGAFE